MRPNMDREGGNQWRQTGLCGIFSYLADPNPHLGNFGPILPFFPWSSELGCGNEVVGEKLLALKMNFFSLNCNRGSCIVSHALPLLCKVIVHSWPPSQHRLLLICYSLIWHQRNCKHVIEQYIFLQLGRENVKLVSVWELKIFGFYRWNLTWRTHSFAD